MSAGGSLGITLCASASIKTKQRSSVIPVESRYLFVCAVVSKKLFFIWKVYPIHVRVHNLGRNGCEIHLQNNLFAQGISNVSVGVHRNDLNEAISITQSFDDYATSVGVYIKAQRENERSTQTTNTRDSV